MSEPKPAEQLRFSEALAELEGIVAALESVALLRACQAKLSEAEHKVTMLMGEIQPVDGEE
jgi:exodeoxyribonuclease VII small subunit